MDLQKYDVAIVSYQSMCNQCQLKDQQLVRDINYAGESSQKIIRPNLILFQQFSDDVKFHHAYVVFDEAHKPDNPESITYERSYHYDSAVRYMEEEVFRC